MLSNKPVFGPPTIGRRNRMAGISPVTGFWLFLVAAVLGGCIGDAFVFFEGRLVSEQGEPVEGCELALLLENEELVSALAEERVYFVSIEPVFKDGSFISPYKQGHYFAVRCPGYTTPYRSKVYVFGGGEYFDLPGERLDLGTIVMDVEELSAAILSPDAGAAAAAR